MPWHPKYDHVVAEFFYQAKRGPSSNGTESGAKLFDILFLLAGG